MTREEYLKKLKESVEAGKVDDEIANHHYAILERAAEKTAKVRNDIERLHKEEVAGIQGIENVPNHGSIGVDRIREEGKPSDKDRLRVNLEYGRIEHVEIQNVNNDFLTDEEKKLKRYVDNVNEILGEEKVVIKNGEAIVIEQNRITEGQITKDRVMKEILLLEEENQRCYSTIARNNDLLTYLKIELNTL